MGRRVQKLIITVCAGATLLLAGAITVGVRMAGDLWRAACAPAGRVGDDPAPVTARFPGLGPLTSAHYWSGHTADTCRHPGAALVIEGYLRIPAGSVTGWLSGYAWRPRGAPPPVVHGQLGAFSPAGAGWLVSVDFPAGVGLPTTVERVALDPAGATLYLLYREGVDPVPERAASPGRWSRGGGHRPAR